MTNNDKIQLDVLAIILDDIGKHLKAIEFEALKLKKFYGIRIADVGIQCGKSIHLGCGIELVEMALRKVAIEDPVSYPKKAIQLNDTEIFQFAVPASNKYRKAEGGVWEVTHHEKP